MEVHKVFVSQGWAGQRFKALGGQSPHFDLNARSFQRLEHSIRCLLYDDCTAVLAGEAVFSITVVGA